MSDPLSIKQADALNDSQILVILSDHRSLLLTLGQFLAANPKMVPETEDDEDSLPV